MCKRNFPNNNEVSTGCIRETPEIKKKKDKKKATSTGCVRETTQIKTKAARDV